MLVRDRFVQYLYLIRLNRPVGTLLLLWPTLWALWLANSGLPDIKILLIFVSGVFLMRSAGCAMNDFADAHFDRHVRRTAKRPIASGKMKRKEALVLALFLSGLAFLLVLSCNFLTIKLAFIGALLAGIYPFLKRITHLPQFGLGLAFSWGVPMSFAATLNKVPSSAWLLFFTCMLWPIIYDTQYALVDKEDDLKIGVKSTAILFGRFNALILALLQLLFLILLAIIGHIFQLQAIYNVALLMVAGLFLYQQHIMKSQQPEKYFAAFLNHQWIGLIIFLGILLGINR